MELTVEQKVSVLISQRKVLAAQLEAQNAQKRLESSHSEYVNLINEITTTIDPKEYRLDLDTLEIKPVQNPEK
jgi:hypothetical protein